MAPYRFECSMEGCDFETEGEERESVAEDAHRHVTEKHDQETDKTTLRSAIVQTS